jgi:23S rRNA (cytidine1920-2'-O)/16S rRNA (cytidine1409-2'-O)-methyltransferase
LLAAGAPHSYLTGMTVRLRADRLLVERGVFSSRAKAQAAIAAGLVTANAALVQKASDEIPVDAELSARAEHPWVSRAGAKLAAALDHFSIDPHGRVCLDVGASTGGFTDVLLSRGARLVYAVDVGRDQLDPQLRQRPEVVSFEHTDIRALDPRRLAELADLIVIDVSFISLELVLPAAARFARSTAELVALIKPQFEAGPRAARKGIVRDAAVQARVCGEIVDCAASLGWIVEGVLPSPLLGREGNREFLLGASRG